MKPKWEHAPEWANWLAMDNNGEWWWYEYKPIQDKEPEFSCWNSCKGHQELASIKITNWDKTLEKKP